MRKAALSLAAGAFILATTTPAMAEMTCDKQSSTAPKSSLGRTQDKYAFYANNINNVGTSWRLEFRPRNDNCTISPAYAQTPEGAANKSYPLHDDPHCNDSKHGYISIDMPSVSQVPPYTPDGVDNDTINVGGKLQGTLKSYKFGLAVMRDPRDQTKLNIVALCTG